MSKKSQTKETQPEPTQTPQSEDVQKSIDDVQAQLKVAWNDERKNQLNKELERLQSIKK